MAFNDHFSGHAEDYGAHRPVYPEALFHYLAGLVQRRSLAWDCATGNGQAAAGLAEYFDRVLASDASAQQVAHARSNLPENVEMRVAPAEASGLGDHSVDLVTVAQALHWFDFEKFYAEVARVLAPGGVLAVWGYGLTRVSAEVDVLVDEFYRGEIDRFWPAGREHVDGAYRDIPFPFEDVAGGGTPEFWMSVAWSADEFLNYLRTWSGVRRFMAAEARDPLEDLAPRLASAWGDGRREVRWPLFFRIGQPPAT
ncbi:MAG: class I SAM-dependent methyltransferase [Verrucomicrobiales bacterium]